MYHKHHTKGIILGGKNEGNDSKRIIVFTEKFGIINTRVQGVRNIHSRLQAGTQDFCIGEFSLVHGKAGWRLVSARSDKNIFEILRSSPPKLKVATNVLNLIKKLAGEEETNSTLFEIVSNFLEFLIPAKLESVSLAECLVLLRILNSLGYMRSDPELSLPISSSEIEMKDLETIAPRRLQITMLINESLKATNLT